MTCGSHFRSSRAIKPLRSPDQLIKTSMWFPPFVFTQPSLRGFLLRMLLLRSTGPSGFGAALCDVIVRPSRHQLHYFDGDSRLRSSVLPHVKILLNCDLDRTGKCDRVKGPVACNTC